MKLPHRRLKVAFAVVALLYAGPYVCMSLQGKYVVAAWTSGGVKSYRWLPHGFGDYRFPPCNQTANIVFAPIWLLDRMLWHTNSRGFSGDYTKEPDRRGFIYPERPDD